MNAVKLMLTFSADQAKLLRDLAKSECLPMATLAKQIILKYLVSQQQ